MKSMIDYKDYVIDLEKVKELSDNGKEYDGVLNQKQYTTTNSFLLMTLTKDFISLVKNGEINTRTKNISEYTNFMLNTLIINKVLIKPRVSKIDKILNS